MIIIIGIAGAGKSVQGRLLAEKLGCPWVSLGAILRKHVTNHKQQSKIVTGNLLQDDFVIPLLEAELKRLHADSLECILDGSPRTIAQAEWLTGKVKKGDIKLTAVIHLHVPRLVAKARLLKRGRPDDNERAIEQRFQEYDETIVKIIDYLSVQGFPVYNVSSEAAEESVESQVEKLLKPKDEIAG